MTPRERIMAVLNGEEPDKIPVSTYYPPPIPGGWYQRLTKRGLGAMTGAGFYTPGVSMMDINPYLPDVKYIQIHYMESGIKKYRHTLETPVGHITGVMASNPLPIPILIWHIEEYFVKQPSDWRVVNYIFSSVLDKLAPTYEAMERKQDELGDSGIVMCFIERTPWQRAWLEWAGPERAAIDFHEQPEEVQEFIEIQKHLHTRIAEFAAESPAKFIDIGENMTDMTSPKYFREYSLPIYEIYSNQLEGTGKVLGAHMDGRFGKLKKDIAESPLKVIESFTVDVFGY
jgi:uroporphyrinogen-III decarboxylase